MCRTAQARIEEIADEVRLLADGRFAPVANDTSANVKLRTPGLE
jgi:hypothetical protein